jgi:hypothetical protein
VTQWPDASGRRGRVQSSRGLEPERREGTDRLKDEQQATRVSPKMFELRVMLGNHDLYRVIDDPEPYG